MIAMSATDVEDVNVPAVPYKGGTLEAKGVSVRWLSKAGVDPQGGPRTVCDYSRSVPAV